MANVLLGVTGSVAALKTPDLTGELRRAGHAVKVVATEAALYFFDPLDLSPQPPPLRGEGEPDTPAPPLLAGEGAGGRGRRDPETVVLDADEWPGRTEGRRWRRGEPVLHIELRRWADLLLIAPLDANTLAKLALGLCDNCLTCVWRAWEPARPVVLAPAMNTLMWLHPATARHLRQVAADLGISLPEGLAPDELAGRINDSGGRLRVVSPVEKRLACDDVGVGAMADAERIVAAVGEGLAKPGSAAPK